MQIPEQLRTAINNYLNGTATEAEKQRVNDWFYAFNDEEVEVTAPVENMRKLLEQQMREKILQQIHHTDNVVTLPSAHRVHFLKKWRWVAASIIVILGIGIFFSIQKSKVKSEDSKIAENLIKNDITPGKSGAILTLADGSQVVLDSLGNGIIASQNGTQVVLKNGGLTYDPTGAASGEIAYNTMTTPKGRQYQVMLPDGTKVWLNAASSLRYPTVFAGKERKVEVNGEAYFEVTKNTKMPFRVSINGRAEVEVLGTQFNVNAYENEKSINTTLLEGSVRVQIGNTRQGMEAVLKPGQQAQIMNILADQKIQQGIDVTIAKSGIKVISNVDTDKAMAWKNGLFNFNGLSLEEAMRQLERWYDIEVVYEKGVAPITFWGKIPKEITLKGLLTALEKTDVHFRIEGRKVIVMP